MKYITYGINLQMYPNAVMILNIDNNPTVEIILVIFTKLFHSLICTQTQ